MNCRNNLQRLAQVSACREACNRVVSWKAFTNGVHTQEWRFFDGEVLRVDLTAHDGEYSIRRVHVTGYKFVFGMCG